jgi:hypothetical protein
MLLVFAILFSLSASGATFPSSAPKSTDNDDTCDIALLPAATLLLPYFEVDLTDQNGEQTVFTISNVSPLEQVAHVTLWTDFGFPVIDFNIYLTGYDVQGINLYDVIALGQIAPPNGTGSEDIGSPHGDFSKPNAAVDAESCRNLPMNLTSIYRARMQQAFTRGRVPALADLPACDRIGGVHENAIGYVTIDVARRCDILSPEDPAYYTNVIAFDNVFVGDFMQVNGRNGYAQGSPLVHIRAVPEGGTAASRAADPARYGTNLPRTFYGRFQSGANRGVDARQPLPSQFAARWITGGASSFNSSFKIWREGTVGANADCSAYAANETISAVDLVRFDEEENGVGIDLQCEVLCVEEGLRTPATSRVDITDDRFPEAFENAVAGWVYLNLHNSFTDGRPAAQAWVVGTMRAEGRFSVDTDVLALGNGCTPGEIERTLITGGVGETMIGPAENVNP